MTKKKRQRFAENATFDHLLQLAYDETIPAYYLKGKWTEKFFDNRHPIILELGCGKGEYTVALAQENPQKNFLGIDIKGARMWRGAKTVKEENIKNAGFLRTRIDLIENLFAAREISGIWITFPDPQPKKERKRLTSPLFIERYRRICKPGSYIHLKTDNSDFFDYTLSVIKDYGFDMPVCHKNIYDGTIDDVSTRIQTYYEEKFLEEGKDIHYLRFKIS